MNELPNLDDYDLSDIANRRSINWVVVDSYIGDERRWGFDRWIVFCEKADLADKYYRFSYYEGVGESEIDFEPTALEEVKKVTKVTYEWVTV